MEPIKLYWVPLTNKHPKMILQNLNQLFIPLTSLYVKAVIQNGGVEVVLISVMSKEHKTLKCHVAFKPSAPKSLSVIISFITWKCVFYLLYMN